MNYDNPMQETQEETTSAATEIDFASVNIAEHLDEQKLKDISRQCKDGFEYDLLSREHFEDKLEQWTKLAMQVTETKTYPWPNASNVKFPLLSTAAMQFAARSYPSLVPSDGKIVKVRVLGEDPTGEKTDKSQRIADYMSYQVMYEIDGWEEDMDKLLIRLPILGTMFKKTYFDTSKNKICSYLIGPKDFVVNNWTKCLDDSERVSEIIHMTQRKLKERQLQGVFLDIDLGKPSPPLQERGFVIDETTPYVLIEQHCFLDLDKDGYAEPYIVTFERTTGKVLRIVARFEPDEIEQNEKGSITRITPKGYYTKFSFVPNPDGSFYDIGFGVLLGPINESVNTLINQLIDAGSLANLQSGFIGKGLRLRMGDQRFQPGEWKPVNSTADDLKKQILPLPTKEPSNVLLELMNVLVQSGKELASVAEIFVGKMPGQNTPATTTMASIEQGMKVFTAVYKRIYRALEQEFKKIYELNGDYLDPNTYVEVLDQPVGPDDFNEDTYDVCPGADPVASSQQEKLAKAQALLELLSMGGPILNPIEVFSRVLQAQEQPNWQQLFSQEVQQSGQVPQQPDPKMMEMQMKSQLEAQKAQMKMAETQQKMEIESRSAEQKLAMQEREHALEMRSKAEQARVDAEIAQHKQRIFQVEGAQKIQQNQDMHQQKMAQQKEAAKSKATSQNGSPSQSRKGSSKK